MEKKRRRELDRLERAATRKGTAKLSPRNNATTFAASSASEDDKEMGLVGDRLLQPKTLYDSSGEADVAVAEARRSERDRDRSDTVEPFDKDTALTHYDVGVGITTSALTSGDGSGAWLKNVLINSY